MMGFRFCRYFLKYERGCHCYVYSLLCFLQSCLVFSSLCLSISEISRRGVRVFSFSDYFFIVRQRKKMLSSY